LFGGQDLEYPFYYDTHVVSGGSKEIASPNLFQPKGVITEGRIAREKRIASSGIAPEYLRF
jgi:hypothetical protein